MNEGFSGARKRHEILQLELLNPSLLFLMKPIQVLILTAEGSLEGVNRAHSENNRREAAHEKRRNLVCSLKSR